jgi:hypothetical protein
MRLEATMEQATNLARENATCKTIGRARIPSLLTWHWGSQKWLWGVQCLVVIFESGGGKA